MSGSLLYLTCARFLLGQIESPMRLADKTQDMSGTWWASFVAFGALLVLGFAGRFGIKAINSIVSDHKKLQDQHIATLKETLIATQTIAIKYETLSSKAIDLIEEDILATKESTRRSAEQTEALKKVEITLDELRRATARERERER
jgi:uncharacterized membrane protein YkvI